MKFIKWIVLIGLFTCAQAQPASFDCAKARSTIERMICNNAGLSDMDAQLGEAYKTAKERLSDSESKQLSSEQRDWLQNVRNRCSDGDCLLKAYETRLNAVDPFADKKITCEEMKKLPGLVFSGGIDLGSGSGSPVEVDYDCAESLKKQAYMQTLLGLAEQIHGDGGPQVCTGSIVHAIWRYYHFSLAEAGFSPRTLLLNKKSTRAGGNWDSLSEKSGSDEEGRVFLYFKQWSEKSLINLRLYADFTAEFDRVLPQLVKHYEQKFKLQQPEAQLAASRALMLVVHRAAGSFPQRELKPDHVLVQLLRDGKTSQNDILRALDDRTGNGPNGSDIYQALVVALLHDRPFQIVNLLAEKISPDLIRSANERDEPLLSFAIRNQKNLEYLLSKNVEVNAQNEFGKTALFYAIGSGNHQAVATLLKHGADVNHAYKSGTELRPDGNECTYPGLSHTKRTPLMHAAQNSDVQMLKILLRAGANIGAVDDVGYNAMDYAAMGKNK